jgi:dolichol-phosphate mannosyltransferase
MRNRASADRPERVSCLGVNQPTPPAAPRVLVIIPTYNEIENLPLIVPRLHAAAPEVHVLVADDNSPDGTGALADELAAADGRIHVLHRKGKEGLGAAYLAGFAWGLAEGYDVICEMDADGSHPPERLPAMLERVAQGADLAIGSRWVRGGEVIDWPKSREVLSRGANTYTRLALGMPVKDATAGFRAFRRSTLEKIDLGTVTSQGYCFQVDLTWRTVRAGLRVDEVPITFAERQIGASKMSTEIIREALVRVTQWGVRYRWNQVTGRASRSSATSVNNGL